MSSYSRFVLVCVLGVIVGSVSNLTGQQAAKPLTEQELIYLLEKKVSSSALANMVDSYGVAFQPDIDSLERLKKAGAEDVLLESVRRRAKGADLGVAGAKSGSATPAPRPIPQPAQQHLELGQRRLHEGDYYGALAEFAEAERIQPKWGQVYYLRGLALEALARYADAAAEWKKYLSVVSRSVDKAPIQAKISQWEGEALKVEKTLSLLKRGDEQLQQHATQDATQSFREAVETDGSVGTLLALARIQLLDGEYAGLSETAQQVLALDAQSALAKFYLADAELRQGIRQGTLRTLQEGLTQNPNLAYGRAILGRALAGKTRSEATEEGPASQSGANAASAAERNRLGWALWNGGHFREGAEELRKAVLLAPNDDALQCDLAYARIAQGALAGALAAGREAVRLNAQSACGHHVLALAMEENGQSVQATQEYQQAQALSAIPNAEELLRSVAVGSMPAGD